MATLLFVLFWIVLGLAIVFVASRGGARGARESLYSSSRGAGKAATVTFLVLYVALGVAVPLLLIVGDRDSKAVAGTGITLTKAQENGRDLFGTTCNQCHTLKAAKTVGKTGPDLDRLVGGIPSYANRVRLVRSAILDGRQQGNGTMPSGLLEGTDANDVAQFVAAVAGK